MAKKKYLIKQQRKINGDVTTASLTYDCEESEAAAIVGMLEGVITVMEENVALSSADGASDIVSTGLAIDSISMVHSEAKTRFFGAYDKLMIFKATTSVVELQNLFKLHKPFNGAYETEFPDSVYPKVGDITKV